MKTYYAIVNVEDRRLGTYVPAVNVAAAFVTAAAKYKRRHRETDLAQHPRCHRPCDFVGGRNVTLVLTIRESGCS